MKTTFSKEYILENKGCYEVEQVEALNFDKNNQITLEKLFETIPIKDFIWLVIKKCDLTVMQKQLFALDCASFALKYYEKRYPNDNRVRNCISATKDFLDGNLSRKELIENRAAAYASAYASASAAAAAADAAAYAAAADAADAAYDADEFKEHVRVFIFETILNIK